MAFLSIESTTGRELINILAYPDYVGTNPINGSIEYVKEFLRLLHIDSEEQQMDGQGVLTGFEDPEHREAQFLSSIFASLIASVENNGGHRDFLKLKTTKSGKSSTSGYTAIYLSTFTVFRLHLRGKSDYISVPDILVDLVPAGTPTKKVKSQEKYTRILIDESHPIDFYTDLLISLVGKSIERFPKEWDCCSRYVACSDAKKCIHPDLSFALACGYRRILNKGIIYYGKNRNID